MVQLQQRTFAEEISLIESMGGEEKLLESLKTDRKRGIIAGNSGCREDFFGHNRKPEAKQKTLWQIFLGAMDDFTLKILVVAALVSICNAGLGFRI